MAGNHFRSLVVGCLLAGSSIVSAQSCQTVAWALDGAVGKLYKVDGAGVVLNSIQAADWNLWPHTASAVAADGQGNVWVALSQKIRKYSADGELLITLGEAGGTPFSFVYALAVDPQDNGVWVADKVANRVVKLSSRGVLLAEANPAGGFSGSNREPMSIAVNAVTGEVWVGTVAHLSKFAEDGTELLRYPEGTPSCASGIHVYTPYMIDVDERDGSAWVGNWLRDPCGSGVYEVNKVSSDGEVTVTVDAQSNVQTVRVDSTNGDVWLSRLGSPTRPSIVRLDEYGNVLASVAETALMALDIDPLDGGVWGLGVWGYSGGAPGLYRYSASGDQLFNVSQVPNRAGTGYAVTVALDACSCLP